MRSCAWLPAGSLPSTAWLVRSRGVLPGVLGADRRRVGVDVGPGRRVGGEVFEGGCRPGGVGARHVGATVDLEVVRERDALRVRSLDDTAESSLLGSEAVEPGPQDLDGLVDV